MSPGLKLQEQAMKVMEHILNAIICDNILFDEIEFGFISLAFVDLEKAFDRVPGSVL